ncbi:MAG: polysaccharide biosynthesis protein [Oscillospiraceae bacterium]|nr:polysaccharide biosynthesis protein [Oscillospiraceae bacterium]
MKKQNAGTGQSMLNGAMILTAAMIMVKIIGLLYKLPLANAFMMQGKGFFSNAFEIYNPIYAIAITGLPIAVSRMVSQRVALGRYQDVHRIKKVATRLFLIVGVVGFVLLLSLAYPYAKYYTTGRLQSLPAILAIAPSIFFCCAMSIYRGYYEGLRNMVPTAVSQVIEALCKLILGLALAMITMKLGQAEYAGKGTVFGQPAANADIADSMLYPWSAAAAILGITVGTVIGFLYLFLRDKIRGDGITRDQLALSAPAEPWRKLLRELITIAIPMVLSSVILNVTNIIDTVNLNWLLNRAVEQHPDIIERIYGASFQLAKTVVTVEDRAVYIRGLYATALDFRNLVPTVVMALGVSALPAISAAWTLRRRDTVQRTVNSIIRISLIISLPAGFGMAVLAKEIMLLFFETNNAGMTVHAAPMLVVFGLSAALMSVSAPIVNMLQGIGRTDVPVKSLIAGAAVKIVSNFILVGNPEINVKGAPIGSVLCYIVIVAINLTALLKTARVKLNLSSVLWKPLFCSILCAAAAWAVNGLFQRVMPDAFAREHSRLVLLLSIGLAIGAAAAVYGLSMLLTRAVTEDDLDMLPKGKKIGKVLAKYGLLG